MNSVSTIVLRLPFIVKISGLSVRADALVFWTSLVKFLTKNYFNHPDVSALNTSQPENQWRYSRFHWSWGMLTHGCFALIECLFRKPA